MRKLGILVFILFCFFSFNLNVFAAICDNNHNDQLKELADKIDINYEYLDYSDSESDEIPINVYNVSVNLISDELYIKYGDNKYYYKNNETINFPVNSGRVELEVYSVRCIDYRVKKIYLDLPKFNSYSYKEECNKLASYELDVCDPWYQGTLNDNVFYKEVNKYLVKEKKNGFSLDAILDFLGDNYLIVGGVLVGILLIILIVVYRKRSVLE